MTLAKQPKPQASRQLYYRDQPNRQNVPVGYQRDSCEILMPQGQHGRWTSGPEQRYSPPRPSQRMTNIIAGRGSDAGRSPRGVIGDGE